MKGTRNAYIVYASAKIQHENYTEILVPNLAEEVGKEVSDIYMKKGGQSMFNFELWKYALNLWSEMIDDFAMVTYNNEVTKFN